MGSSARDVTSTGYLLRRGGNHRRRVVPAGTRRCGVVSLHGAPDSGHSGAVPLRLIDAVPGAWPVTWRSVVSDLHPDCVTCSVVGRTAGRITIGRAVACRIRRTVRSARSVDVRSVLRRAGSGAALTHAVARLLPERGRDPADLPLTDYKAANYWLGYRFGFVRRGLPGEILRRVVAGPPTYRHVAVTAVGLSRAAVLSVVPMALQAARRAPRGQPRVAAAGLLLLSPLTCSLLRHDVGRYDAVGVLVLALLAAARPVWRRLRLRSPT